MQLGIRLYVSVVVLAVALVAVGVSAGVRAFTNNSGSATKVINVQGNYIEAEAPAPVVEDEGMFGAVSSPYLNGPDFAVGKDLKFSVSAPLADSTSTWAYASPFRKATSTASDIVVQYTVGTDNVGLTVATTTVELVRINFTSSTPTAYEVGCGSSNSPYTTSTNSVAILTSDNISAARTGMVENGLATGAGAEIGGGAITKIRIGSSHPYIVCRVYSSKDAEWSTADGVSPGDIAIRFSKVQ